jgi:hypothetical protein
VLRDALRPTGLHRLTHDGEGTMQTMLVIFAIAVGVALISCEGAQAMPGATALREAAKAASAEQIPQRARLLSDRINRAKSDAETARQMGHHARKHHKGTYVRHQ